MKLKFAPAASLFALGTPQLCRGCSAEVSPLDLVQPIADYKIYVSENAETAGDRHKGIHGCGEGGRRREGESHSLVPPA